MSPPNIEIVREVWRGFAAGGFPAELFAADVLWHEAPDQPDGGGEPRKGPQAIAEMLARGWETVTDPWIVADEFVDAGDRVVVVWRGGGTGRASGLTVEWHETHVYELHDGLVSEVHEYRGRDEALASVGLGPAGA
jgi:ketosteroid isomerase-like protein